MVDPLVRTVLNLMTRFGGDATLVVVQAGEYDPETSTTTTTEQTFPIRVLTEDYIQKGSGITTKAGTLIQTGDKRMFIKPADGVPAPRAEVDHILFQGVKWAVQTFKDYNPSGTSSYLYEVYARQ